MCSQSFPLIPVFNKHISSCPGCTTDEQREQLNKYVKDAKSAYCMKCITPFNITTSIKLFMPEFSNHYSFCSSGISQDFLIRNYNGIIMTNESFNDFMKTFSELLKEK